jgi:hypothetical protein
MVKYLLLAGMLLALPAIAQEYDVYSDYPIKVRVQGEPMSFANNLICVGVEGQLCGNNSYCGWFACRKTEE